MTLTPAYSGSLGGSDSPVQRVHKLMSQPSIFPDENYALFDWKKFFDSGIADVRIDIYNPDYRLLNAAVFYQTNRFRENHARKPLKFSPELRDAAVFHSLEMAEQDFYSHLNHKNKDFKTWGMRAKYFGYPTEYVGENIHQITLYDYDYNAYYPAEEQGRWHYYKTDKMKAGAEYMPLTYSAFAENVVKDWANSKGHRANMLHLDFFDLGCGVIPDINKFSEKNVPNAFATQLFGNR